MQAMLLAVGTLQTDAEALRSEGVEVHVFERAPSLREVAEAALELRKRHPRLPLVVAGPARMVRELERKYPPLVDVALTSATAEAVLAALAGAQR